MASSSIDARKLDLRIVPTADVLLHEETDPDRVSRLRQAVVSDNLLRNPPIVVAAGSSYVVLDGATRSTAIRTLACPHLLVQVVDYTADVLLDAWYHLLRPPALAALRARLERGDVMTATPATLGEGRQALAERRAAAVIAMADGTATLIQARPGASVSSVLRDVVAAYGGYGEIYRIVNDDLERTIREADDVPAVVLFPSWQPTEILGAATTGDLLPAGITRHMIPGRALNVNTALDILMLDATTEAKNAWLEQWLRRRLTARKVRFYHEAVFVFDD